MSKKQVLHSFADLKSVLAAPKAGDPASGDRSPAELYARAKAAQAAGRNQEAVALLERVKHMAGLPERFRRLIQERITAVERIGHDLETKELRRLIREWPGEASSLPLLDRFRLRHKLDQPQRLLSLAGIDGLSTIGVYRWSGDIQSQQLWSQLLREAKAGDRPTLGWFGLALAEHWKSADSCHAWQSVVDLVVPVPASPEREAERKVDVAAHIAERLARIVGLPLHPEALHREAGQRAYHASLEELRSQYWPRRNLEDLVQGRAVLLVDDVVTRGRTVGVCAELLRAAGASAVYVLAVAQAETTLREQRHLGERSADRISALVPWLCLARTPDLGPVRVRALLERFGSPDVILTTKRAELREARGIGPKLAEAIVEQAARRDEYTEVAARQLADADKMSGGIVLTTFDPRYPSMLLQSNHAVPILYSAGRDTSFASRRTIAIVGSRRPVPDVVAIAREIAETLARDGWVIVSGLAEGCDALAHEGALAAGKPTWAFLGCGVDKIYPASNKVLRERILANGRLFSEYPFGVRVAEDFLRKRNNLIVGASKLVIILQTAANGGTMNAARSAIAQGRPLLCLPPLSDSFSGNLALLRDGKAKQLEPHRVAAQVEATVSARLQTNEGA